LNLSRKACPAEERAETGSAVTAAMGQI
jgi:hypothetical protein